MRLLLVIVFSVVLSTGLVAQESSFTPVQRARMLHVVEQTGLLKSLLGDCFAYNREPFYVVNHGISRFDAQAAEDYLSVHPDSLVVDWASLSHQSPGVLAELAVKLALWELVQDPDGLWACEDASLCEALMKPLHRYLPERYRERPQSKGARHILGVVMHPSRPLSVKRQQMEALKVTPREQRQLLMAWSQAVERYVQAQGRRYFTMLAGESVGFELKMMAAGEGSGTAGLLGAYERRTDDTTRFSYAKGCGLFNYQFEGQRSSVTPRWYAEVRTVASRSGSNALHGALWGVDGKNQALVVVTRGDRSYHLFPTGSLLTPDQNHSEGMSYLDYLQAVTALKVERPVARLQQEGGLNELLQAEYERKEEIEVRLRVLESEIDSLQRMPGVISGDIQGRRQQINVLLGSLSARERRIVELGRKVSAQVTKAEKASAEVDAMQQLLGPAPQRWEKQGELYRYDDGVMFDATRQDLIFPDDMLNDTLTIRLVSAAMTLSGRLRDEVQLLVCMVNVPPVVPEEPCLSDSDEREFMFYYHPDAIVPTVSIDSLITFLKGLNASQVKVAVETDVAVTASRARYADACRERMHPLTDYGRQRYARVRVMVADDVAEVFIVAGTDPVPTRLSGLTKQERRALGIHHASVANNEVLARQRGEYLRQQIETMVGR
ncbi:MAG: hypothetical protein JXR39_01625 [Marinilabiliaceae bacterium]|nr:hypothetical protein [Marinilabiliaceae bacterium]